MRVVGASLRPLGVPFARPLRTAGGTFGTRETVLVALVDEDGRTGFGEAAPWAPFGDGDLDDALRALAALAPPLRGVPVDDALAALAALEARGPGVAAARAALETALLDLRARAAELPLAALLAAAPAPQVALNAVAGDGSPEDAARAAGAAVAAGFAAFKLKVGARALDDDVARVRAARAALGTAPELRLDANGAWDEPTARRALAAFAPYAIAYVEQPVATLTGLAALRDGAPVRIAADEALPGLAALREAVALAAIDVAIVKPMRCGGPRAARALVDAALAAGIEPVVTSTFETGPGLLAALHLAAGVPGARAHGLATAPLLGADLLGGAATPHAGVLAAQGPGLGAAPDPALAEHLALAPELPAW